MLHPSLLIQLLLFSAEEVQSLKEEDIVEQLHQEKNELQIKLDKLERVLHKMNAEARQAIPSWK